MKPHAQQWAERGLRRKELCYGPNTTCIPRDSAWPIDLSSACLRAHVRSGSPAQAEEAASPYGLYVQGTAVTAENASHVLGPESNIAYDPESQTLTLGDTSFMVQPIPDGVPASIPEGMWCGIVCDHDLTIKLEGRCSITCPDPSEGYTITAIGVADDLIIVGDGELYVDVSAQMPREASSGVGYVPPFTSLYGIAAVPLGPITVDPEHPQMPECGDVYIGEGAELVFNLSGTEDNPAGFIGGIGGGKIVIDDRQVNISIGEVMYESAGIFGSDGVDILGNSNVLINMGPLNCPENPSAVFLNGNYSTGIDATASALHVGESANVSIVMGPSNQSTYGVRSLTFAFDGTSTTSVQAGASETSIGVAALSSMVTPWDNPPRSA